MEKDRQAGGKHEKRAPRTGVRAGRSGVRGSRERALAWGPGALLVLFLATVVTFRPEVGLAMLRFLPLQLLPLGSESSLLYLMVSGVSPLVVFAFLCIVDLATSFPFLVLAESAEQIPFAGRYLTRLQQGGLAFFERHPWLQRMGPLGLLLYVALPLSGTGTTMGVLVGRVTGIATHTVAAVVLAGTLLRWSFLVGAVGVVATAF